MAKRKIYRFIRGRIKVFSISSKNANHPSVIRSQKDSANIKKILKKKAAARTSLAEKRISAIRDVAAVKKQRVPNIKILGSGSSLNTVQSPVSKKVVKLTAAGSNPEDKYRILAEIKYRGKIKAMLSKMGLAPETFTVRTDSNSYLVQDLAPKIGNKSPFAPISEGEGAIMEKLRKRLNQAGFKGRDLNDGNIGKLKGRKVAIDSGLFEVKTGMFRSNQKRIDKFTISKKRKK